VPPGAQLRSVAELDRVVLVRDPRWGHRRTAVDRLGVVAAGGSGIPLGGAAIVAGVRGIPFGGLGVAAGDAVVPDPLLPPPATPSAIVARTRTSATAIAPAGSCRFP
jgi:hypothetical protein